MRKASNYFSNDKGLGYFLDHFWLGLRMYAGLFCNLIGFKYPIICGHKVTYNCNLRCKMCPFWKRASVDQDLEKEKALLEKIREAGVCLIAFEGGEPLLREDLPEILCFSRSLGMHTSLVTNGLLLCKRVDSIAPYIDGGIYVSLDGIGSTHDNIRGVSGCFEKAVDGISACRNKVIVRINTTVMQQNIHELERLVSLAKELDAGIAIALAYEYCDIDLSPVTGSQLARIIDMLIEMKKRGYPIINSMSYLKVMKGVRKWKCKPWAVVNFDPEGRLVLPCYARNDYKPNFSIHDTNIRSLWRHYDWDIVKNCSACSLHCYVEPSLVLSFDFGTYLNWANQVKI